MIYKKIAELQLPTFTKNASNPHFKNKYITLDQIMAKIRPILKAKGLVTYHAQSETGLETGIVDAETGEKVTTFYPILSSLSGQKLGSELTYARRYSICLLLAIVADEDDDGNQASKPEPDWVKLEASARKVFADTPDDFVAWCNKTAIAIEQKFGSEAHKQARELINRIAVELKKGEVF